MANKIKAADPYASFTGPLNFEALRQSVVKTVIPEVAKVLTSIVTDLVVTHNNKFIGGEV